MSADRPERKKRQNQSDLDNPFFPFPFILILLEGREGEERENGRRISFDISSSPLWEYTLLPPSIRPIYLFVSVVDAGIKAALGINDSAPRLH